MDKKLKLTALPILANAEQAAINVYQNGRLCGTLLVDSAFQEETILRIEGRADLKSERN